jgi:hypothetical protein
MPISFSAVKELSVKHFFLETITAGLKGPLVLECLQLHICQKGLNFGEKNNASVRKSTILARFGPIQLSSHS